MIRLLGSPEITILDMGDCSRDPYGRPDPRWRSALPAKKKMSIELEFEDGDHPEIVKLLEGLGYRA